MNTLFRPLFLLALVLLAAPARAGIADARGLWQFDADNLNNSVATGSPVLGAFTTVGAPALSYQNDTIGGLPARVLSVSALDHAERLYMPTGGGGNGGGTYLNQWTIVMDVKIPVLPAWTALLQTAIGNTNDADVHIEGATGRFYCNGQPNAITTPAATVTADTWTRIAITCGSSGVGNPITLRCYLNGVKVYENAGQNFDGTYSLDPYALLFSDNDGDTGALRCNSIGFWRDTLTDADIATLGGPASYGISRFVVTSTAYSGTGTLNELLTAAALADGPDGIIFAPALSGQTITLSGEIAVLDGGVTVDAGRLPAGVTISGGTGTDRLFRLLSGTVMTLRGVTLTAGHGGGTLFSGDGGAIHNGGTLALDRCTLHGNSSPNSGVGSGGAIYNTGTLTLTQCTLSGNTAPAYGGGIYSSGILALTHCTLSGNDAGTYGDGIYLSGTLNLNNSIIAGNGTEDLRTLGTINLAGVNFLSTTTGSGLTASATLLTGDALLAPLGNYGGPTQTRPPQPGSPAINAATSSSATTDQRGLPQSGGAWDIGACERQLSTGVLSTADTGEGSLRFALLDAASIAGADTITFAPALSGQTISLGSEIVIGSDVAIDASNLSGGLTIDDGTASSYRLFTVNTGQAVILRGLVIAGGNAAGAGPQGDGGAIYNNGALTLTECTLSGNAASERGGAIYNNGILAMAQCALNSNSAYYAGAIYNKGSALLSECTLSGNSTFDHGGAISNSGTLTLTQCTLSGNSASFRGGAISNFGTLTLTQCTLSGNTAPAYDGGAIYSSTASITGPITSSTTLTHCTLSGNTVTGRGGAILNDYGRTTLTHCAVSGNTAPAGQGGGVASFGDNATETVVQNSIIAGNVNSDVDFVDGATNNFTSQGYNLIGSGNATGDFTQPGDRTNTAPLLAPLGGYGGPTQTMPPLPGSPAIDAATGSTITSDQRGLSIRDGDGNGTATPDIGAAELQRIVVTNTNNSGPGSLRQALADDASSTTLADLIVFDSPPQQRHPHAQLADHHRQQCGD